MGKRPRISKELIGELVIDPQEFIANKGSKNARKILEKSEEIHIEIWFDKHFFVRHQHGSDNGDERIGIDPNLIKDLIVSSLGHVVHYSFCVPSFAFLNKAGDVRSKRLVIQKDTENGILNVVVAFYHIEKLKYEVTVFTAMCIADFNINDGQFVVLMNESNSELFKKVGINLNSMDSI